MSITRRRLFAVSGAGLAGGGAAAVLSACGTEEEEPSAERDVELLNAVVAAQASVAELYKTALAQRLESDADAAIEAFDFEAGRQLARVREAIQGAGGTPADADENPPEAESVVEALTVALRLAIAACHDAAGELSTPELNRTVLELVATDAAQLAALRGLLGEEQAREPFVTGLDEPPLVVEGQA
jgi:hypothetical protein